MEKKLKTTKRKIGKKRQEDKERDRRNKGAKNILTSSMVVPKSGISVYTFHTPEKSSVWLRKTQFFHDTFRFLTTLDLIHANLLTTCLRQLVAELHHSRR